MRLIKIAWLASLATAFTVFCLWYGGNGKPISPEEGASLLMRLEQAYQNSPANEGTFIENIREMIPNDDGKEFYAVNLEKLKNGTAADEADAAYTSIVMPLLFKRASHPVFVSERAGLMLGDYGREVDRVAVVRYRSLKDLISMTLEPTMVNGSYHKFDALVHTEVLITRPIVTFVHVRLTLGLILILVALAGLKLIVYVEFRRNQRNS